MFRGAHESIVTRSASESAGGGPRPFRRALGLLRSLPWGWLVPAFTLGLIMLIAEGLISWLEIPVAVAAKPSQVITALISDWKEIWQNLQVTIVEALAGFAVGTLAAICTALLFTLFHPVKRGFLPLLVALQTIPIIVFAPMLTMVMGDGMAPKIVVAALICYFPTVVNMVKGLNSPNQALLDLFTVLNASRLQVLFKLRLPSSLSFLFSSIKIATANCFIGALIAEWISATSGAGYVMVMSMSKLDTPKLYAAVVATSVTAIVLYKLAEQAEVWLMPGAKRHSLSKFISRGIKWIRKR